MPEVVFFDDWYDFDEKRGENICTIIADPSKWKSIFPYRRNRLPLMVFKHTDNSLDLTAVNEFIGRGGMSHYGKWYNGSDYPFWKVVPVFCFNSVASRMQFQLEFC